MLVGRREAMLRRRRERFARAAHACLRGRRVGMLEAKVAFAGRCLRRRRCGSDVGRHTGTQGRCVTARRVLGPSMIRVARKERASVD